MQDEVNQIECKTDENGFFAVNFTLKESGYLILETKYAGDGQIHGCSYGPFIIRVEESPLITKIIQYIGVAAPLSIVGLFILYIVKMRG